MRSRHWILAVLACALGFALGCCIGGWFGSSYGESAMIGRTLVLEWGDQLDDNGNVSNQAMYGAHAFVVKGTDGYSVFGRVYIDRPDGVVSYFHDGGPLGHANNFKEAQQKWGKVTWTADSVYFGDPRPGPCRILRKDFQRHR